MRHEEGLITPLPLSPPILHQPNARKVTFMSEFSCWHPLWLLAPAEDAKHICIGIFLIFSEGKQIKGKCIWYTGYFHFTCFFTNLLPAGPPLGLSTLFPSPSLLHQPNMSLPSSFTQPTSSALKCNNEEGNNPPYLFDWGVFNFSLTLFPFSEQVLQFII